MYRLRPYRSARDGSRNGSAKHPYPCPDSRRRVCRRPDMAGASRLDTADGCLALGRPDTGDGNRLDHPGTGDGNRLDRLGTGDENLVLDRPDTADENLGLGRPDTADENLALDRPDTAGENLALDHPDTAGESLGFDRPDTADESPPREARFGFQAGATVRIPVVSP